MVSRRNPKTVTSDKSTHVGDGDRSEDVVKTPDRLALDDVFLNHEALRRGLTENLKARRIESDKISERVKKAFEHISLSKPETNDRDATNHVAPDASTLDAVKGVVSRRLVDILESDAVPVATVRAGSKL